MTTHATPSASRLATRAKGHAAGSGEPVLASKITPPGVPDWAVPRPRITKLIAEGAGWQCSRSRIRASMSAGPPASRPASGRLRRGHARWRPAADRPDPVALLEAQNLTREPDLVAVRHGRMMVSPFTLYRGAAKIMAADLKDTPVVGLDAQLCGDAYLSNFGVFASPERRLMFDLNPGVLTGRRGILAG